ncbi:MAG TPA: hypothetical protein VIL86_02230, partial [Tepidisphaeraceae bacterium]
RVVIATVDKASEAKTVEMLQPGMKDFGKALVVSYTVTVSEDLGSPAKKDAPAETIEFLAPAREPMPGNVMVGDGPNYPVLQLESSYVLLLDDAEIRQDGKKDKTLFLPAYFKNFRPVEDELTAKVRDTANIDKWPWGDAKDGLELAVFQQWPKMPVGAYFHTAVAARNVSKKPIKVDLTATEKHLRIFATDEAGKALDADLYRGNLKADKPVIVTVAPGEVIWVGPSGPANYGMGFTLPVTPGEWTLQASYENTKQDKSAPVWTGKITSAKQTIEVTAK